MINGDVVDSVQKRKPEERKWSILGIKPHNFFVFNQLDCPVLIQIENTTAWEREATQGKSISFYTTLYRAVTSFTSARSHHKVKVRQARYSGLETQSASDFSVVNNYFTVTILNEEKTRIYSREFVLTQDRGITLSRKCIFAPNVPIQPAAAPEVEAPPPHGAPAPQSSLPDALVQGPLDGPVPDHPAAPEGEPQVKEHQAGLPAASTPTRNTTCVHASTSSPRSPRPTTPSSEWYHSLTPPRGWASPAPYFTVCKDVVLL